uniref:Sushi domain-containing protein n=1 Tax=Pseudonaja textilis TaxID=8673 RepID=A0A670ZL25_PSETE
PDCGDPPRIENGDIIPLSEQQYRSGSSVEFRCQEYYAMEGQNRSFCDNGAWTKLPVCLDIEGGCGHPPAVDNADIVELLKETYIQSESVTYQCQNLYIMKGSARVTCQNGHWSKAPTCTGTNNIYNCFLKFSRVLTCMVFSFVWVFSHIIIVVLLKL